MEWYREVNGKLLLYGLEEENKDGEESTLSNNSTLPQSIEIVDPEGSCKKGNSKPVIKDEYAFIIQGDMTPFQRATLAKMLYKKAVQLGCGLACNYHGDGSYAELTYEEMMDKKNHPKGDFY